MMKKLTIILSAFSILLVLTLFVFAAEGITYEFDDVKVVYATEFDAKPILGVDSSETWVSDIVGEDKRITVTYGVVELIKDGTVLVSEEFIKVGGEQSSKRFLLTSTTYDYYEQTNKFSQIRSFFWSAKKLDGVNVVKDFTPPIYSVSFSRKFNTDGSRDSFFLSFSNDGEQAFQNFWQGDTPMYEADTASIRETGDATASGRV